jgi:phosphatidylinositol alpha-1,6-mannosyltransferase
VLEVLPGLVEDFPDLVYLVAGEGPLRGALEEQVVRLGLREQVRFVGYREDRELAALYQLSRIFVMPATESDADLEGFGIVYLEAGFFGTPPIGSRTGGIPDAVEDGVTGLLVDPGRPEELDRAIRCLLTDEALHARLAAAGRQRVLDRFFGAAPARRFLERLRQAVAGRP